MNGQEALAKLQENGFIIAADAAKLITEHQNPDELYLFAIENLTDKSVLQAPDFEKKPEVGDKITFLNAGAYNYSSNFFNLKEIETEIKD